MTGDLRGGCFVQSTVFQGTNGMRVIQQEILGPVVTVVSFIDYAEAIAYETIYGPRSGAWLRDAAAAYETSQVIHAGRVWVSPNILCPAGAGLGGYKQSGYGRETDQHSLHDYQEVKNLLVNHDPKTLGLFG